MLSDEQSNFNSGQGASTDRRIKRREQESKQHRDFNRRPHDDAGHRRIGINDEYFSSEYNPVHALNYSPNNSGQVEGQITKVINMVARPSSIEKVRNKVKRNERKYEEQKKS